MSKKITIQAKIMKELFLRHREMTIKELSENLRLKYLQVKREISELARMGAISRRYEKNTTDLGHLPPYKKVFIKIKNVKRVMEVLHEKSML